MKREINKSEKLKKLTKVEDFFTLYKTEDRTSCYSGTTSIKVFLSSFPHHTGSVSNPLCDDSGWSREWLQ
jgi:hypothetical protein